MPSVRPLLAAASALAVLTLPAAAAAKPKPTAKHERTADHGGHAKPQHKVSLLLRGTWSGDAMQVKGGNRAARRAGLVGQSVSLDLVSAKLRVRDTNGDGARDAEDVRDGDRVVVQVRMAAGDATDGTLTVRKLVARADGGDSGAGADDQGTDDAQPADDSTDDAGDDSGTDA
jgi:hypothetical protein